MKKFTLLLACVLVSAFAWAGRRDENPKSTSGMAVVKSNAMSYKLIYKSELASDVKVQIFDQGNALVFSETIRKSSGFMRPYNFESLSEGEYTIRIDNGSNWLAETVNYRTGRIEKLAHLVPLSDGRYLLTVAGKGQDQLNIRIFDKEGEAIYSALNKVDGDFGQIYNLGQMSGPFSFEVTGNDGSSKILSKLSSHSLHSMQSRTETFSATLSF